MKRIPLGQSGLSVTPIGFGAASLGDMPDTYGYSVSEDMARATINAVFDSQVNVFDTSNNYGFGRSEARIGAVIRDRGGLPDGMVLATKIDRDMETGRYDASRVRQSLEESLTRLGLDSIPLLHLHDPEYAADLRDVTCEGGAVDALFKIKDEGLAQAVGLAMGRLDIMEPILRANPFDAVLSHNRFTLLNRSASDVFDYATSQGMAVLNAAPYASGVLAKGADTAPLIAYQTATEDQLAPVRQIETLCAKHGVAPGALALQFSMRDPRMTSTIVGITKPERIAQTLEWASANIPQAVWDALADMPFETTDPEANRDYKPG